MIELYSWQTSNGRKVSIMLEELGMEYEVHAIDISKGEQFKPAYIALNPNSKIPTIVARDAAGGPYTLFESGAILMYLADQAGKFFPTDQRRRHKVIQWLMFQMGGIGPMFGQVHHFLRSEEAKKDAYGIKRYTTEMRRLYGVMDARLPNHEYLADDYSIADIATFPWVARYEWQGIDFADFANVGRWFASINARPAVQKGLFVPEIS